MIAATYSLQNEDVPVLARRKETDNPFGFTIRDIVSEPARMLKHQLYNIEQTGELGSDWVPFLEPWHGVGIYADAFGAATSWPEDDYPWTGPRLTDIRQAYDLKPPASGDSPLMEKVLETIRWFRREAGREVPISLTDTQSPMNTASMIVPTDELLAACYTDPGAVHHLLGMIADLVISFSRMQLELIGERAALPGHLFPAGARRGISVSDDNACMASPQVYREFFVPYLSRISRAFGGLYLHACGNFLHNLEAMLEIEGLLGVNMHIGPGDMDPRAAAKVLGGRCLLWADVSIRWQRMAPTVEEFFLQHYLPGLLAEGGGIGVMVEAPPLADPGRRKEMVDWTRRRIRERIRCR
jgi:uroporphyrinogen-III decarboxylase